MKIKFCVLLFLIFESNFCDYFILFTIFNSIVFKIEISNQHGRLIVFEKSFNEFR